MALRPIAPPSTPARPLVHAKPHRGGFSFLGSENLADALPQTGAHVRTTGGSASSTWVHCGSSAARRANKHPAWHVPVAITGDRLFGIATVLRDLLDLVATQSRWPARFAALLAEHPDIPLLPMGIPANW